MNCKTNADKTFGSENLYNVANSWTSTHGCKTCTISGDLAGNNDTTGGDGNLYNFPNEYYGTILTDWFCLFFDPIS